MSDIAGTARISAAAAPQGASPGGSAGQVINPPPSAQQLLAGDSLYGTVLRFDSKGHVLVATELGTLSIRTPVKPAVGSHITLQVRQIGSELLVLLFSGHGARPERPTAPGTASTPQGQAGGHDRSPPAGTTAESPRGSAGAAGPAAQTGPQPRTDGQVGQTNPHRAGDLLSLGQRLTAVLQSPAPASAAAASSAPPAAARLPAGAEVQLRILSVAPAAGAPATETTIVSSGDRTRQDAQRPLPQPSGSGPITAVVVGQNREGQTLLRSPLGLLSLDAKATLPMGARLTAELGLGPSSPPAWPAGGQAMLTPAGLAIGWTSLEEAADLLFRPETPTQPASAGGTATPRPGQALTSELLFFMSALKGGRLDTWLGRPALEALRAAGGPELIARVGDEFQQLVQLASDSSAGEWRTFLIPLFDGHQLQQLRLYLRHGRRGDGGQDDDSATRFLLDLEISRLGALQLDRLVRPGRFDLMLRSRRALPSHMQRDIVAIFDGANEASGNRGRIQFQASKDWLPQSLPDVAHDSLLV